MNERILGVMRNVLQTENIDENTNQCNCEKWDSLHHLNLIVELEDEFDVEFEPEEIAEMKSFDAVKRMLESKL